MTFLKNCIISLQILRCFIFHRGKVSVGLKGDWMFCSKCECKYVLGKAADE
jgi:hypothetical protein